MCRYCHQKISDKTILETCHRALVDPKFDRWNTTSLSHMYITASGYNGKEAQELARQLLQNFIDWAEKTPDMGSDCLLED